MIIRSALAALLLSSCAAGERSATPSSMARVSGPTVTLPGSIDRGRLFAQTKCSACHAVGPEGASPLSPAPPLRDLSRRYPVEQLGEAFAEGFVTAHRTMPEFVLERGDNDDLIAYLVSIQTRP